MCLWSWKGDESLGKETYWRNLLRRFKQKNAEEAIT